MAGHPLDLWRCGQVNRSIRSLFRRNEEVFHQAGCQAAQSRLPVDNDIGGHDSRVQTVGCCPGSFEAPGQFIGEEDIGQLGLAIGLEPAVAAGEVNVVEMNAADFVGHRGQGDYPAFGRDDEVQ